MDKIRGYNAGMRDREELVKLADELGAMSARLSYEQDRMTVIAACELLRRLASTNER